MADIKKLDKAEAKAHKEIKDAKTKKQVLKGLKADEKVDAVEKKLLKKVK